MHRAIFDVYKIFGLTLTLAISMANDDDKRLGKYLLKAKLGQGGMGTVYLALDTRLKREVALKVLPREFSKDLDAVKRFLREGQAAARLNHPNVVAIYDVDQQRGHTFLVMELVNGGSAHDLIKQGYLAWPEATRIIAAACRGLAAAHEAGLIHRDIKPSNILLAQDGSVKVSDFGLVKVVDEDSPRNPLTRTGAVLGTPDFMSPEQCQGEKLDERSDVYSLGATYFALLTRRAPYSEDKPLQTMFAHCSKPVPDPRSIIADLPAACAEIVMRCLAKKRADRFASVTEFNEQLQQLLADSPTAIGSPFGVLTPNTPRSSIGAGLNEAPHRDAPTMPESNVNSMTPEAVTEQPFESEAARTLTNADRLAATMTHLRVIRRQRWFWAVATVSSMAVGGLLFWATGPWGSSATSGHPGSSTNSQSPPLPDANRMPIPQGLKNDGQAAEVTLVRMGETQRVDALVRAVAVSPDESLIYVAKLDGQVMALRVETRGLVREFKGPTVATRAIAAAPNGQWIAAGSDDGTIWIWNAKSAALIATIKDSAAIVSALAFRSDSQRLAVGSYGDARLYALQPDGSPELLKRLGDSSTQPVCYMVMAVTFSPDRRQLAVTSWDSKQVILYAAHDGTLIANQKGLSHEPFAVEFLSSERLLVGCSNGQLVIWEQPGRSALLTPLPRSAAGELRTMSMLPDGRTIVTAGEWGGGLRLVDLYSRGESGHIRNDASANSAAMVVLPKSRKLVLAGGSDSEHKGFLQLWDIVR